MRITFSIEAKNYIETLVRADQILVLFYDTDGCGCAVNGVPILKVETEEVKVNLIRINTNDFSVYMYEKHLIFFDDDMKLHLDNNSLRLSSNNQIFTAKLVIKPMEHL
ncbi:MAG: iron-sulfur cluster biosynthesis family protein [Anaerobacillus sp.]|uniref:iron-sulfur cluster biosynthesis family protein n=1 Tax=Anaerobacillus sp. TaxID=1872506 RepID=UPI003919B9A5